MVVIAMMMTAGDCGTVMMRMMMWFVDGARMMMLMRRRILLWRRTVVLLSFDDPHRVPSSIASSRRMTLSTLDVWNEWIKSKQQKYRELLSWCYRCILYNIQIYQYPRVYQPLSLQPVPVVQSLHRLARPAIDAVLRAKFRLFATIVCINGIPLLSKWIPVREIILSFWQKSGFLE